MQNSKIQKYNTIQKTKIQNWKIQKNNTEQKTKIKNWRIQKYSTKGKFKIEKHKSTKKIVSLRRIYYSLWKNIQHFIVNKYNSTNNNAHDRKWFREEKTDNGPWEGNWDKE